MKMLPLIAALLIFAALSVSHADTTLTNQTLAVPYTSNTSANLGTLTLNGTSTLDLNDTASVSVSDSSTGQILQSAEGGQETIVASNNGSGNFVYTIGTAHYGRSQGTTINYIVSNTGSGTTTLKSGYNFNGGDGNDLTFWAFYDGNDFAATSGGVISAGTAYYNDGGNDTGAMNLATWSADTGANQDYTSDSALTSYAGTLTGNAVKHGLRVSNSGGAAINLGTFTLTEAGIIDAQGAGTVTISNGNLTAQNLTNELIINQNNTANAMTVSANITGGGSSFVKAGVGTLITTGANSYGTTTWVNEGILVNNGTTSGTNAVYVNQGATLAGTGSITTGGSISVNGTIAPGNSLGLPSVGTLTLGLSGSNKLAFATGSTLAFDINGGTSDQVAFSGLGNWLSGSGDAILALNASGIETGYTYVVFSNVTTTGFTFANITGDAGYTPTFSYMSTGTYADDYVLTFAETPEPSTYAMLFGGLGMLVLVSHFRGKLTA